MSFLLKKINEKKSNVLIIGLGYVGWPLYLEIKKKDLMYLDSILIKNWFKNIK